MQLKKIEYFIKIVETGSLSKAADQLYLTQPTLSRFLANLEQEFGVKLFERGKNNSLTLTECGKKYYESALKINGLWQELAADIVAYKDDAPTKKTMNIGVSDDDMLPYVSDRIDRLSKKYPDISFHLYCDSVGELHKKIADGTLDIAASPYLNMSPELVYIVFRRSEVDMVVSKDNPLAQFSYQLAGQQNKRLSLLSLEKSVPFTLMREHTILRQEEERYFDMLNIAPNIQSTYTVHETVEDILAHNNKLVGFCPRHIRSEKMAYIALEPPFYYKSAIYYRKDKVLTAAEKTMIAMLKELPRTRSL